MVSAFDQEVVVEAFKTIVKITEAGNTTGHKFQVWFPKSKPPLFNQGTTRSYKFTDVTVIIT